MSINYGEKILKLRRSLGLSQAAFADKLGVRRYQISSIELNKNKPTLELITSVINNFQIKSDYFFLPNVEIERYDGSILTHSEAEMSNYNSIVTEPKTKHGTHSEMDHTRFIKSLEDQIEAKDLLIKSQAEIISLLKNQ
jgi:transcriptional regulator with XRE-family HTH domain